ncbi:hypothetical protein FNH05_08260 [Amycolatopsis rhizosphaerae]|uniref:Uncharacterized protein n=1 Tax=Amycolatopsis rhizosphaerae TaxID=2053003 RepID=A0A558D6I5_9PSEU|nr:hypothetical protein [Amycolatopsis rhizosphaerae]TVT56618.1 hypothetical protein FNH05_08260 [Amycolatopsis rhizosphaerae]
MYSLWQHGVLAVPGGAGALGHAREVLLRESAEPVQIGELSSPVPDRVLLEATWVEGRAQVRALLVLDEPEDGGGRLRWRLLALSDRAWQPSSSSPVTRLGLPEVGVCSDPAGVPMLIAPDNHVGSSGADTEAWGAQTAARLRHPDRSAGLAVVTVEAVTDVANDPSVMLPQFGWPGLLTCVIIDESARTALNHHCRETPVPERGARLFPAVCDTVPSDVLQTSQLTKSRLATMVRQVLTARQDAPLPVWAGEKDIAAWIDRAPAAVAAGAGVREHSEPPQPRSAQPEPGWIERERLLAEENARLRTELAQAQETIAGLRRALEAQRGPAAPAPIPAGGRHHRPQPVAVAPTSEHARFPRQGMPPAPPRHAAGNRPVTSDAFGSFGELIGAARSRLKLLVIGADPDEAAALDSHPRAALLRREAWRALCTLQVYAHAKATAHAQRRRLGPELRNLLQFVSSGQEGALIGEASIKLKEPPDLAQHPVYRRRRTYPVPKTVDDSGWAFFPAHIRLGGESGVRLQFLDDTSRTGNVYIGYLGEDRSAL